MRFGHRIDLDDDARRLTGFGVLSLALDFLDQRLMQAEWGLQQFVQFADLDEATVVGWVQSSLSADEVDFWTSFEQRELAYYDDTERHGASRQVTAFATYTPQDNGVQAAPWESQE